ncbi:ribosome small subunit-dependent GTPase A [Adlercreutzia sp. ZJ304]|uniref:ribosome small subunit-dependent GTPase A n=1 Tax=Adlercreutzia sp. ZJ304 TaxID=2709791 RepID=UPI001F152CE1|nr:ribosome small subunit-dependent GTPase A [Adlercreutzia sp. ZJ304]
MSAADEIVQGQVVKLDRGLPLVALRSGHNVRCEHSTELVKTGESRAVIGDEVQVLLPRGHDVGVIQEILERRTQLVRKDPTERAIPQVLAANFDTVIIAQPVGQVNMRRLQRELVLAFETGARVAVVLTKADLADDELAVREVRKRVHELVGADVSVVVMADGDAESVERVRQLVPKGTTAVLIGRSGVGKSTLINFLTGEETRRTANVREVDGKGRHTTVNREIIPIPDGGCIVDMPGVRGLGLWEADAGIDAAFADIEELAASCRFRDCKHGREPGCAVRLAVESGSLAQERFNTYMQLRQETADVQQRREEARWRAREKAPGKRSRKANR